MFRNFKRPLDKVSWRFFKIFCLKFVAKFDIWKVYVVYFVKVNLRRLLVNFAMSKQIFENPFKVNSSTSSTVCVGGNNNLLS